MAGATPYDPDELLRPARAAELLDFTERFLEARRRTGDGPPFVRVSARAVRYRRRDLIAWAEEHLCRPGADSSGSSRAGE